VNAAIALAMFVATTGLALLISNVEAQRVAQPAE
jgi:hypothetical protein